MKQPRPRMLTDEATLAFIRAEVERRQGHPVSSALDGTEERIVELIRNLNDPAGRIECFLCLRQGHHLLVERDPRLAGPLDIQLG